VLVVRYLRLAVWGTMDWDQATKMGSNSLELDASGLGDVSSHSRTHSSQPNAVQWTRDALRLGMVGQIYYSTVPTGPAMGGCVGVFPVGDPPCSGCSQCCISICRPLRQGQSMAPLFPSHRHEDKMPELVAKAHDHQQGTKKRTQKWCMRPSHSRRAAIA